MREPKFWYQKPGLWSFILTPLAWLYGSLTAHRLASTDGYSASVPVICVGNINAGGTGKTPTAIAIVQHLQAKGLTPYLVSRGHGGSLSGPIQVDPVVHSANETGDEPLLLAAFAPTWVAKNRAEGVQQAERAGANVIILDDGHQNPTVRKDVSLVVVDARRQFGNGYVIPAGPLREKVHAGLSRADVVVSIGDTSPITLPTEVPQVNGALHPLQTGMKWDKMRVFAFAGIGEPAKFFATLRQMGAEVIKSEPLEDHQPLTEALMKRLETEAKAHVAQLVTTEKDAVRLPMSFRQKVLTVPVRLEIQDWTELDIAFEKAGIQSRSD